MEINIAFGVSRNWLKYTGVTMTSILMNSRDCDLYNFYILVDTSEYMDMELIKELKNAKPCNIKFFYIDKRILKGADNGYLGVSSYFRILLPEVIKDKKKLLYLDSDIVVTSDISELYSIDVSDYSFAAVQDIYSDCQKNPIFANQERYYNSGMLLMNLERLREEKLSYKMLNECRRSKDFTDQDVINYLCYESILSLPIRFNCMNGPEAYVGREEEYQDALKNPYVIHYAKKPWDYFNRKNILVEHWFKYADMFEQFTSNVFE